VKQTINFLFFERDFGVKNDPLNNTKEHKIALVSFRAISWMVSFFFWLRPGHAVKTQEIVRQLQVRKGRLPPLQRNVNNFAIFKLTLDEVFIRPQGSRSE
jgi:hypothetical protein